MTDLATTSDDRLRDFTRIAADWSWEVDADLHVVTLAGQVPGGQPGMLLRGQPLASLGQLLEEVSGELPIERARRERSPFRDQLIETAGGRLYRLAGVPLLGEDGDLRGFRGLAFATDPQIESDERFVASLGSELRAPLDAIIAAAEAMATGREAPLSPTYIEYARDIAAAGRHLQALLGDLFDGSKTRGGMVIETFDLRQTVEQAVSMIALRAEGKRQSLQLPPTTAVSAQGDGRRALQILVNLLTNAVKFTPEDGDIRVEIERLDARTVAVHVSDTGPGIAVEDQERVFAKFERLPGTGEEGSGLGLHIARDLARRMGGDLKLKSAPGEGARFTLQLPAA